MATFLSDNGQDDDDVIPCYPCCPFYPLYPFYHFYPCYLFLSWLSVLSLVSLFITDFRITSRITINQPTDVLKLNLHPTQIHKKVRFCKHRNNKLPTFSSTVIWICHILSRFWKLSKHKLDIYIFFTYSQISECCYTVKTGWLKPALVKYLANHCKNP